MPVTERHVCWTAPTMKYTQHQYPLPNDPLLPRMFPVSLFVGTRGSGKSYACASLIKRYEESGIVDVESGRPAAQRVYLFSPTIDANPVFDTLKHLSDDHKYPKYSDELLAEVVEKIKEQKQATADYQRRLKAYRRFLRLKNMEALTTDELNDLALCDFESPPEPECPNGCVHHIVLDDLVGSSAFKTFGRSFLTNLCLRNRHLGIAIYICSQNMKLVPKSIRINASLFVVFRFASLKIVMNDLYPEISSLMNEDEFEMLYEHCTAGAHECLVVDFSMPPELRVRKNFDTVVEIKNE